MTTRSKTSSKTKSKTTTSRDSLRAVRDDLGALTKRLQAADKATNKSVAALETALTTLAEQTRHAGTQAERKDQIDTQIQALKSQLTGMIRETQRAVNTDLKAILDDPQLGTISQALNSANARVERAEAEQLRNLTTLKSYISSLAREVDVSLENERNTRQTEIAACVEKIDSQEKSLQDTQARLSAIETDTAAALELVGDKVTQFAEKATEAREENTRALTVKITDIALETQKNFDQYKDNVDRNIEALNTAHENAKRDNPVSGAIATIEDAFSPPSDAAATPGPLAALQSDTPQTDTSLADMSKSAVVMPFVASNAAAPASANPYAAPDASLSHHDAPPVPELANHGLAQQGLAQPSSIAPLPQTDIAPEYTTEFSVDPYAQLSDDSAAGEIAPQLNAPSTSYEPGYDDMPYENPAYAEDIAMDTERPGGPVEKSGGAKRGSLFTPSNLRAAMLGIAVLGAGYIAVNTFKGGKSDPTKLPSDVFVENKSPKKKKKKVASKAASAPAGKNIESLEPIGQYTQNIDKGATKTAASKTAINNAVKSGDPAAQYQLGLASLQNGDTEKALKLLRASANKGQPAAQYRLGKLYETGEGVTQDLETARELIGKSARNGNRIAMHDLANFYANGIGGVEQDLGLAAKWFEKAAERGVVDSQYNIGYLYEFGFGVTKNPVTARVWYGIASGQGDTEAEKRVTVLNDNR